MKRYIQFILNGKRYRFLIDEELDKILKRTLRERYRFDANNVLNLETTDLASSYKEKQLIFKAILNQIDTYDLPPELKGRINTLKGYINTNKSDVYHSDLIELDSLLSEASEIYGNVRTNLEKKEVAQVKREQAQETVAEIEGLIDDTNYESDDISDTVSTTDDKIDEFNAIIEEIALDESLKDEVPIADIKDAVERIVICDTMEDYVSKTGSSYDLESSIKDKSAKIVLPPNSKLEDVVVKIINSTTSENTLNKVITYMDRKAKYQNKTSSAFESLRSNLKVKGLNGRNLNYFGDQFILEYQRICQETGISFESMFADYFNGYSQSRRYNSPLDKFIRTFIKFNGGGDQSLRGLLEAVIIKKATAAHLIQNRYNNYLTPSYRNLSVNGSGTINFGTTLDNKVSSLDSSLDISGNTRLAAGSNITTSKEMNRQSTLSSEGTLEKRTELNGNISNAATLNMQEELQESGQVDASVVKPSIKAGILEEPEEENIVVSNTTFNNQNGTSAIRQNNQPIIPEVDGTAAKKLEPIPDLSENPDIQGNPKVIPFPGPGSRRNIRNKFNSKPQNKQNSGSVVINLETRLATKKAGIISPPITEETNETNYYEETSTDNSYDDSGYGSNYNDTMSEAENDSDKEQDGNEASINQKSEDSNNNLEDAKQAALNVAGEEIKKEVKKQASKAIMEFIKKNSYVLAIAGVILLLLLIVLLTMADMEEKKRQAYNSSSSGCAGEGGNLVSFLAGWEGTSGEACTKNGLSGHTAVNQGDGTLTTGAGVTNHLVSSISDYIRENNLTGYFHLNSGNNTYFMSLGDCIPDEVSEELKEVGVREIYAAPIEPAAAELGIVLTEYQKDALTSFNYNLGAGHTKELLQAYKDDGYEGLWNKMKVYVKSQGEVLSGLKKRRKGEFALFVTGDYSDQGAFYGRSLDNYDDYNSENVKEREYICVAGGDGSLIANIDGFMMRTSRPLRTNSFYYNDGAGNEGECAWYAPRRAREILASINSPRTFDGRGLNGGDFCHAPEVLNGTFQISKNVHEPQPGSLISWKKSGDYGHVAVVEQVNPDGSILISEAFISLGIYGKNARTTIHSYSDMVAARRKNCEGNNSGCFQTRTISADRIQNAGWSSNYQFDCYVYLR